MDPNWPEAPLPCAVCGTQRRGRFCHACGQEAVDPRDRTIRPLLERLFGEITSLEGRLWRSVIVLLRRPGQLTRDYVDGRRVIYLHPVRLFLLINILYFVVQPMTGFSGYNTPLRSHLSRQLYSDWVDLGARVSEQIDLRLAATLEAEGLSPTSLPADVLASRRRSEARRYTAQFDQRASALARSFILLFIPAIAAMLALLYSRRGFLLADHAVMATHFMAWELLAVGCLYLGALGLLGSAATSLAGGPEAYAAVLEARPTLAVAVSVVNEMSSLLLVFAFLFLAMRRFYGDGAVSAALRAAVLSITVILLLPTYRFLLFWVTYWTL